MNACSILACPVCGAELVREGQSLFCRGERVHTYDAAREGYVNLLPPGRGRNSRSGDEAAMIRARSAFLSTGAYDAIPESIARMLCDSVRERDGHAMTVLDCGCGEGYHSIRIAKECASVSGRRVLLGAFDASKSGSSYGARRAVAQGVSPRGGVGIDFDGEALVSFVTGNIFSLPVKAASADAAVSMFAPIAWDELRRVLVDGGVVAVAASGERHLYELREILYESVITKKPSVVPSEGFESIGHSCVKYQITLDGHDIIMSLFGMTPFCYNAPREGVRRLEELSSLTVTVECDIFIFRKI